MTQFVAVNILGLFHYWVWEMLLVSENIIISLFQSLRYEFWTYRTREWLGHSPVLLLLHLWVSAMTGQWVWRQHAWSCRSVVGLWQHLSSMLAVLDTHITMSHHSIPGAEDVSRNMLPVITQSQWNREALKQ